MWSVGDFWCFNSVLTQTALDSFSLLRRVVLSVVRHSAESWQTYARFNYTTAAFLGTKFSNNTPDIDSSKQCTSCFTTSAVIPDTSDQGVQGAHHPYGCSTSKSHVLLRSIFTRTNSPEFRYVTGSTNITSVGLEIPIWHRCAWSARTDRGFILTKVDVKFVIQ